MVSVAVGEVGMAQRRGNRGERVRCASAWYPSSPGTSTARGYVADAAKTPMGPTAPRRRTFGAWESATAGQP
eukprot:3915360-Pleurochrysis_carterae.AAC.1